MGMNQEHYDELKGRAAKTLEEQVQSLAEKLLAQPVVNQELQSMVGEGKVIILTEEEEKLVSSFRRFRATVKKAGAVFKWQTTPLADPGAVVVIPENHPVHVVHPQDVSE